MITVETETIQVRVLDDGFLLARRHDRGQLTEADRDEAKRIADSQPGITAATVMRVFGGGWIRNRIGEPR